MNRFPEIGKQHNCGQDVTHADWFGPAYFLVEMNPPRFSLPMGRRMMAAAVAGAGCFLIATSWAGMVDFSSTAGYAPGNLNGQPAASPKWVVVSGSTAFAIPTGAGKVNVGLGQSVPQYAVWQTPVDSSATPTFSYAVDFSFVQLSGSGTGNLLGLTHFLSASSVNSNVRAYFGRTAGTDAYRIGFYQNSGSPGTSVTQTVSGVNLGLNSLSGANTSDQLRLTYTLTKGATSWTATVDLEDLTTGALVGHLVSPSFTPSSTFNADTSLYCAISTETVQSASVSSLTMLGADLPGVWSPSDGLTMTFDDEFTSGFDPNKWNPHYTKSGGGSLEAYVPSAFSTAPGGGALRITATNTPFAGRNYTSGAMTTYGSFAQTYGYFEARAKVPKGYGFWPAFWMLSVDQSWPPEIDIYEILGKDTTTVHQTLHWPGSSGQDVAAGQATTGDDLSLAYHTYGVSWKPQLCIFYLDGIERFRVTGTNVPSKPEYLLVNMAIGPSTGGWAQPPNAQTVFPNYYDIDYVRAYKYPDTPTVPDPAISLGMTHASVATVAPGGTVTINSSVKAGPNAITTNKIHVYILDFWGQPLSPAVDIVGPAVTVPAGGSTPFSVNYTVPTTLAPGTYSAKIQATISGTSTYCAIGCATRFTVSSP